MSVGDLERLQQQREQLLLAEVAAWLHDMGKCTDEHIIRQARDDKNDSLIKNEYKEENPENFLSDLPPIRLFDQDVKIVYLIKKGRPRFINRTSEITWIARVLGKCHAIAHMEKELPRDLDTTKQPKGDTRPSSAFGVEGDPVKDLTQRLKALPFDSIPDRSRFVPIVEETFKAALADTRRPINDVSLADWSSIIAALFKAALAGAVISNSQVEPDNLRWRLLRVNFDVLGLYAKAIKIADLLAYRRAVDEACAQVKRLVEDTYPFGNEIYRDTTGIYFTFPNLDLPEELKQEILRCVNTIEPELAPRIAVVSVDDEGSSNEEFEKEFKRILSVARRAALEEQPFDTLNLDPGWQEGWVKALHQPGKWEVCPVCRLRPKEESAEVCEHCSSRRRSRLQTWQEDPAKTIWIGEIADHNDRVALLLGKFGLNNWLSGDLIPTMLAWMNEADPAKSQGKNPSPARLRLVWETCQRFWDVTVTQEVLSRLLSGGEPRQHVLPDKNDWTAGLYNGRINARSIDLFWQPEHGAFLTLSNLQAAGGLHPGDTIVLEDPDARRTSQFQIREVRAAPKPFHERQSFLPLLASPEQFLALVPAARALDLVKDIRDRYVEHFGKVRNRLPLALGLVFFERKMPLLAGIDAARQMLNMPLPDDEKWTVANVKRNDQVTLEFENGVCWQVPTKMGDKKSYDIWYPYFKLDGETRSRKVIEINNAHWVHVKELDRGDQVRLAPSVFDFVWFDAASRRFAIAYGERGRRLDRLSRPYFLEDIDRLECLWQILKKLSRTQIKQTLQTIETARESWFGRAERWRSAEDQTFKQFIADTLVNAQWIQATINEEERTHLVSAAARGELADLVELHFEILKERHEGVNS